MANFFQITDQVKNVLHRIPVGLQEAVSRLVNPDTRQRPSTQLLSLIQYFRQANTTYLSLIISYIQYYLLYLPILDSLFWPRHYITCDNDFVFHCKKRVLTYVMGYGYELHVLVRHKYLIGLSYVTTEGVHNIIYFVHKCTAHRWQNI